MHRALVAAGIAVAILSWSIAPVGADNNPPVGNRDSWGWTDDKGVGAGAQQPGATPVSVHSGADPGPQQCHYEALNAEESASADDMAVQGWGPPKGNGPGAWYRKICDGPNGYGIIVWGNAPGPSPLVLAQQALGYTPMPPPGMGMNPPASREQLVNLTTFLWLDQAQWQPVSASASAGGVTVVTTAVPQRVVWDMGNGESVTCDGPGVPYDPSKSDADQPDPCRFVYRHSSAGQPNGTFTVTATVSWHVTWAATGVPAGQPAAGDLGVVTRSSSVAVRVAEAEATNTNGQ